MSTAFARDVRHAIRVCLRERGFTAVATLTLGLAIGANTAAFSLIDALFLRPAPHVVAPGEIVIVASAGAEGALSYPDYLDYSAQNHVFSGLAAYTFGTFGLGVGDATQEVNAYVVTSNYFSVLGVGAAVGRAFDPAAGDVGTRATEVVLSYTLWQTRFAGDPAIAGRAIRLNGAPFTVIGVAPRGFLGTLRGFAPDLWIPLGRPEADARGSRSRRWLTGLGRLRPGVSAETAESEMAVIAKRLADAHSDTNKGVSVWVTPERRWLLRQTPQLAFAPALVAALVGIVLVIACVNLGGLLAARSLFRRKEIALRVALGASRGDLLRQLLTESLVLGLVGGAAGVGIAVALLKGVWGWILRILNLPALFIDTSVNGRMLGFTLAVALGSAVLFGTGPAVQASALDVYAALGRHAALPRWGAGRSPARALVVCEVALSIFLLVCAGLFLGPLRRASQADLGYPVDDVFLAQVNLRAIGYRAAEMEPFYTTLVRRFQELPGVEAVGLAQGPVAGQGWPHFLPESAFPHEERNVVLARIGPGFFRAVRIPILAGREFTEKDSRDAPKVVIVNERLAARHWPGEDVVGRLLPVWPDQPPLLIVGVAKAVKTLPVLPLFYMVYLPYAQQPVDAPLTLHVRLQAGNGGSHNFIQRELRAVNPALPPARIRPLRDRIEEGYSALRLAMTVLVGLGATALLLSSIGLYGLTAYVVGQRTYEIGVRRALGADALAILRLVVEDTLRLVALGLACGLLPAAAAGYATHVVVGTAPDAGAFVGSCLVLVVSALVAACLPARRALAVDPATALRCE